MRKQTYDYEEWATNIIKRGKYFVCTKCWQYIFNADMIMHSPVRHLCKCKEDKQ